MPFPLDRRLLLWQIQHRFQASVANDDDTVESFGTTETAWAMQSTVGSTGFECYSLIAAVDSCPSQGDTWMLLPVGGIMPRTLGNLPGPIRFSINGSSTTHANPHQRNLK
jgi:hypothetical protein